MQTKLDALTREAFDLQETINWKDKKIGVGGPTWGALTEHGRQRMIVHSPLLPFMWSLHVGDPFKHYLGTIHFCMSK